MAIDVQALLRRVVAAVFDADVEATYSTEPKAGYVHHVRLTAADGGRHAGLSASYEGFDATILDLGVSTSPLDYDDEEEDEEPCSSAGGGRPRVPTPGGRVARRPGSLRSRPLLRIVVDDRE